LVAINDLLRAKGQRTPSRWLSRRMPEESHSIDRIELHFQERGEREVKSSEIGERVMEELHRLDGVAYVRFASVYRQFKDIQEFMDELKDLLGNREEAKKK
jgi:transcriptional repressor NrdR